LSAEDTHQVAPVFEICKATWRDLNDLHALEHDCFNHDAWSLLDLVGVLTLPSTSRLKAIAGDQMVGFIAGDIRKDEDLGWITTVGVLHEYRRMGLGKALMNASERDMKMGRVCLCVRKSNQPAITMYRSLGYHSVDVWQKYYEDGEDAMVMEKRLRKSTQD
jgi:ribosomal protein S18 acetylase RimI-like enzyme